MNIQMTKLCSIHIKTCVNRKSWEVRGEHEAGRQRAAIIALIHPRTGLPVGTASPQSSHCQRLVDQAAELRDRFLLQEAISH